MYDRYFLGIDPALSTGYCLIGVNPNEYGVISHGVVKAGGKEWGRCMEPSKGVYGVLNELALGGHPQVHNRLSVYMEGYGFARFGNVVPLVEVGTMFRYVFTLNGVPWMNIPPTVLKKFVTGSGNSGKDVVIKEVWKRFGVDCVNSDEADSVGLAFIGVYHCGLIELPKPNCSSVKDYVF